MARNNGVGRRGGVAAGVCGAGGAAVLLAGVYGLGSWRDSLGRVTAAAGGARVSSRHAATEMTITSPRPYFVPLNGQGPALSAGRVVWTANNAQGQPGSAIDRIYLYDLARRRSSTPVASRYGTAGFIGGYALAGNRLAYVDTGVTPSRIFTWRVCVVDLRGGGTMVVETSPPGASSYIPPRIAFDGTHLLVLQSVSTRAGSPQSVASLYTLPRLTPDVLARLSSATASFSDPVLARGAALWTTQSFGSRPSSRLTAYDLRRHTARAIPVGDVSELSANGDLVVWKSGMASMPGGRIGLYSVGRGRVLSADLAHGDAAIYPSVGGELVSWTSVDFSRVQVYSLTARRVVYNAPAVPHRIYGLSSVTPGASTGMPVAGDSVAWVYTANASSRSAMRGYIVVRVIGR